MYEERKEMRDYETRRCAIKFWCGRVRIVCYWRVYHSFWIPAPAQFSIYEESLGSCLIFLQNKSVSSTISPRIDGSTPPRCAIRKFASEPARNFDDSHGGHVSRKSSLLKLERVFTQSQEQVKMG